MRLSDVMSHLGLAIYPILGMFLFLSVFVGAIVGVTRRNRRSELDAAAHLPLIDDATTQESRR
jgi:cbb3-type cytochrome oxidase subunit 3